MISRLSKLVNLISGNYYLLQLRKDQWGSLQELRNTQLRKLRAITKYAYDHIPYYHRLFSSLEPGSLDVESHDDMKKIPVTSKQDIQKNPLDMVPLGVDTSEFPQEFTSGSTGVPLKLIYDHSCLSYNCATRRYPFFESGVKPSDKFVLISARMNSISSIMRYATLLGELRQISVPLLPYERLTKILSDLDPDFIWANPSILPPFASYDISEIRPKLIFTQGEVVTADCRDVVREIFGSELLETYGSVEFGHLAFECHEHCGLHMITHGAYIEFVDENNEHVSPGEEGEILVTGLFNHVMPLIRYRIGDLGIPSDEKCPCGRSWPLIRNIQGRINDYLVLPSGKKVNLPHFYHCIYQELNKNVFSVSQYQIVQDRKDRIVFKAVKGKEFDPQVLERIRENLESHLSKGGESLEVVVEITKEIQKERTGKRRVVISSLR